MKRKQREAERFIQKMKEKKRRIKRATKISLERMEEERLQREKENEEKKKEEREKFIEDMKEKAQKRHENFVEKYGKFNKKEVEEFENKYNEKIRQKEKKTGGMPLYKYMKNQYELENTKHDRKVFMKLKDYYRPIDFQKLDEHDKKIRNLIKSQKKRRDQMTYQKLTESMENEQIQPIINTYEKQMKKIRENQRRLRQFSKSVNHCFSSFFNFFLIFDFFEG